MESMEKYGINLILYSSRSGKVWKMEIIVWKYIYLNTYLEILLVNLSTKILIKMPKHKTPRGKNGIYQTIKFR